MYVIAGCHIRIFLRQTCFGVIKEGGSYGAYYSIEQAIWKDSTSIKNGSIVQLNHKNVLGRNRTEHLDYCRQGLYAEE